MDKHVSVIVATLDNEATILDCLQSLAFQSTQVDYDIHIIDRGSKDDTLGMLKDVITKWSSVHVVDCIPEDLDLGQAYNLAINHCNGRILMFVNPRYTVDHDFVAMALNFMDSDDNCQMLKSGIGYSGVGDKLFSKINVEVEPQFVALRREALSMYGALLGETPMMDFRKLLKNMDYCLDVNAVYLYNTLTDPNREAEYLGSYIPKTFDNACHYLGLVFKSCMKKECSLYRSVLKGLMK